MYYRFCFCLLASYMFLLTYARLIRHANMCACSFHWILLDIKVDEGKVEVLASLLKKESDYSIVKGIVNR